MAELVQPFFGMFPSLLRNSQHMGQVETVVFFMVNSAGKVYTTGGCPAKRFLQEFGGV